LQTEAAWHQASKIHVLQTLLLHFEASERPANGARRQQAARRGRTTAAHPPNVDQPKPPSRRAKYALEALTSARHSPKATPNKNNGEKEQHPPGAAGAQRGTLHQQAHLTTACIAVASRPKALPLHQRRRKTAGRRHKGTAAGARAPPPDGHAATACARARTPVEGSSATRTCSLEVLWGERRGGAPPAEVRRMGRSVRAAAHRARRAAPQRRTALPLAAQAVLGGLQGSCDAGRATPSSAAPP